jgi:hypothetical protein
MLAERWSHDICMDQRDNDHFSFSGNNQRAEKWLRSYAERNGYDYDWLGVVVDWGEAQQLLDELKELGLTVSTQTFTALMCLVLL